MRSLASGALCEEGTELGVLVEELRLARLERFGQAAGDVTLLDERACRSRRTARTDAMSEAMAATATSRAGARGRLRGLGRGRWSRRLRP